MPRIAVVGSGVAGLSAAYHLRKHGPADLEVMLLEASSEKIGGHANTLSKGLPTPVDAGFMVMNHDTYPNLLQFFADLGVPLEPTDMSFCVTDAQDRTWTFGWNPIAWLTMLPTPRFWHWVLAMDRFHGEALAALDHPTEGGNETIGAWLARRGYHESIVGGWIVPFCAAVWSSPTDAAGAMNARALFGFLRNHGFLNWRAPQWLTPKGRCGGTYLPRIEAWFQQYNVQVRLGAKVVGASYEAASGSSSSDEQRIRLKLAPSSSPSKDKDDDDADLLFDKVIFASPAGCCNDAVSALMPSWHSPKAPLDDGGSNKEEASDENSATISTGADHGNITGFLGHFRSHTSEIVVHSDKSVMPKYQYLWASWTVDAKGTFTYWLNKLQGQPPSLDMFETLNPLPGTIDESCVLHRCQMSHPVMDGATLLGQSLYRQAIQQSQAGGQAAGATESKGPKVLLAGAYLHHGFHEDGFRSGIEAARHALQDFSIPLLPVPTARVQPLHWIYRGTTSHARFAAPPEDDDDDDDSAKKGHVVQDGCHSPVAHNFSYRLAYDYVDTQGSVRYWWGGLFREDHFGDPDEEMHLTVRRMVANDTGYFPAGPIDLMTSLRVFGYCFNPISFYFVWADDSRSVLDFIVSEVASTPWDQRTVHVLDFRASSSDGGGGAATGVRKFVRLKSIHVSPFNPVPDGEQLWEYAFHALPGSVAGAKNQLHVTVSLFANAQRHARKQPTVVADLNVTQDEVQETRGAADLKKGASSANPPVEDAIKASVTGWLKAVAPSPPPVPWSVVNQARIHWHAIQLAMKGLAFVPNTGWSAAPSGNCPLAYVAPKSVESAHHNKEKAPSSPSSSPPSSSSSSSSCPLATMPPVFGSRATVLGAGARTAPLFLEHAGLIGWFLVLWLLWLGGILGTFLTIMLVVAGLLGLEATALIPIDITGRRRCV